MRGALVSMLFSAACGGGNSSADPAPDGGSANPRDGGSVPAWMETFDEGPPALSAWFPDPVPADGPYADQGGYFTARGITAPDAFRSSTALGLDGWLTLEAYSRSSTTDLAAVAVGVPDPQNPANRVLRLGSPRHTDAVVLRSTQPLPNSYRISLRIGFADFGDGRPGLNGYQGGETAEPWSAADATRQNGFYWLAILDAVPRPHNNVWIHHHRKVSVDSDNNVPPAFSELWTGSQFASSGERPVTLSSYDGTGQDTALYGKPPVTFAGGAWQPPGQVRAVDAYLPDEWYQVTIERRGQHFSIEVSGRFQFGGSTSYRAELDAIERCLWHYNRSPEELEGSCVENQPLPESGEADAAWPAASAWPDYFMVGDPHANYYRGTLLCDDVRLEPL